MMRVVHLVKNFGEFTAVGDISFDVAKGEIFAFLGPNGAGKTTTIRMLTTLLQPTSGAIEVDGLNPAQHKSEVRKRFGIVFQDPSLDQDLTAWENMELHGVIDHGRIVATGSPWELKEQTGKESLEEAFLALTGTTIRDESAGSVDQMRQFAKMWRR